MEGSSRKDEEVGVLPRLFREAPSEAILHLSINERIRITVVVITMICQVWRFGMYVMVVAILERGFNLECVMIGTLLKKGFVPTYPDPGIRKQRWNESKGLNHCIEEFECNHTAQVGRAFTRSIVYLGIAPSGRRL